MYVLDTVTGASRLTLRLAQRPKSRKNVWLLYVAMTRAKDQLHLMVPQRFFTHGQRSTGDRHVYAQRTRFIPNSILKLFENQSWPPPKSLSEPQRPAREKVDVRAKMRQCGAEEIPERSTGAR